MHESIRLFDAAIEAAGAKTVLYMTWTRRHAPESQQAITDAYLNIGRELGATVIPVGVVWEEFRSRHDEPELYDRDQSHPTLAGSYLAACVFLARLLGEDPIGIDLEIPGLNNKDMLALQKAAGRNHVAS